MVIRRAPAPEDIIWNNLGQTRKSMVARKFIIYLITLCILGGSFGIIYILSLQQNKSTDNLYLSFVISISISIINVILQRTCSNM